VPILGVLLHEVDHRHGPVLVRAAKKHVGFDGNVADHEAVERGHIGAVPEGRGGGGGGGGGEGGEGRGEKQG